jgi:SAM-dependent methyltransferase
LTLSLNFDRPHATLLVEARQKHLAKILPDCMKQYGLRTAMDAGCGVGYFSGFLLDLGFQVTAFDARPSNIEEARRRHPGVSFHVADMEDRALEQFGQFDFVLCYGLIYHLENPMRAFRLLRALTGKLMLLEGMAIPEETPTLYLRDEPPIEDQGATFLGAYPSEGALWKMAYRAGFQHVARMASPPDHEDYRSLLGRKRVRAMMAASTAPLGSPHFVAVSEPQNPPDPWTTDPTGITKMFRRFRNFMRKPASERMAALRRRYLR